MTRSIYVLYTGGTFGMAGSPLTPMPVDALRCHLPDVSAHASTTLDALPQALDSSSIGPADWIAIAKRIEAAYDAHDGFVVVHGTDTLAYTAAALSFLFDNLAKPVVVTGAQRAITETPNDAERNYIDAVRTAAYKTGLCEVAVVFGGRILRGCRARKISASDWTAFATPNCPALGAAGEKIVLDKDQLRPPPSQGASFRMQSGLNPNVVDITLTPALTAEGLKHALQGADGAVLRTYGAGNAPRDPAFNAALKGPLVVATTQCLEGAIDMSRYATGAGLAASGVVPLADMTPEAALVKLMRVLADDLGDDAASAMQADWRGELTPPQGD